MTNIVAEQRGGGVEISGFNFHSEVEPSAIYYSTEADRVWYEHGGGQHAAILIRFDIDGAFTSIDVDLDGSSDTHVLDRAIAALTELRDRRQEMAGPGRGRCMAAGGWGRCQLEDGHGTGHAFPTEDEYRAFPKSA